MTLQFKIMPGGLFQLIYVSTFLRRITQQYQNIFMHRIKYLNDDKSSFQSSEFENDSDKKTPPQCINFYLQNLTPAVTELSLA